MATKIYSAIVFKTTGAHVSSKAFLSTGNAFEVVIIQSLRPISPNNNSLLGVLAH